MENVNLRTPTGDPVRITNSDDVEAPRVARDPDVTGPPAAGAR